MLAWSLVVTAALVPAGAPGQTMAGEAARVMSFNIRYGNAADGPNHWDRRHDLLADTIRAFDPDLLGTQEILAAHKEFLDVALPGHRSVGAGRDDGKLRGEMNAIWYRHDRFEPLDHGHFWLSETPHVPGSVSRDSALTRMATWIRLRDHPQPDAAEGTFNGFRAEATVGPRIDWIGVSPGWRVLAAAIDRTARDGRTPSDHFPVIAVLGR